MKVNPRLFLICILGVVAIGAFILIPDKQLVSLMLGESPFEHAESGEHVMQRLFGSEQAIEIVRNPDKVLLYSVSFQDKTFDPKTAKLSAPVVLPEDLAQEISRDLTSPQSYEHEMAPACDPVFGVKTVFRKRDREVSVLYCLWCAKVIIDPSGKMSYTEAVETENWYFVGSRGIYNAAERYFPKNQEFELSN